MTLQQSIERLSHFRCGECHRWWSVGDAPERDHWFCPWCGKQLVVLPPGDFIDRAIRNAPPFPCPDVGQDPSEFMLEPYQGTLSMDEYSIPIQKYGQAIHDYFMEHDREGDIYYIPWDRLTDKQKEWWYECAAFATIREMAV